MSVAATLDEIQNEAPPSRSDAGPAPKRIVVAYGFWIFILSDIVMFSALFAAYAVLVRATAGGPDGRRAVQPSHTRDSNRLPSRLELHVRIDVVGHQFATPYRTYYLAAITFVLGAAFLALEIREFAGMIARGATPQRSAFLSAFFTLVGAHGLHVAAGLIWLALLMAHVAIKGFAANVERRLRCFALYWHALDIIWVWLFTVVYLMGVRP
jgi:cytochrome o ubiquinol oxidase subunit 3